MRVDPHQIHNLAASDEHRSQLEHMRAALDHWLESFEDLGLLPEEALRERMWPGGEQPVTALPSAHFASGALTLRAADGASIEVREPDDRWRLYTEPVALPAERCVEVRAIRYGALPTDVVTHCAPLGSASARPEQ